MTNCCSPAPKIEALSQWQHLCPQDGTKGKPIPLITLKSLLIPPALEQLDGLGTYYFCPRSSCPVVYFNEQEQTFMTVDLKVAVFQKDKRDDVPVCYCFGWSRQRIREEIAKHGTSSVMASITAHIKAKRCGCEVNNPQGSCCLGNIRSTLNALENRESALSNFAA